MHVPQQMLLQNDEFPEIGCIQEHQSLCFVSDFLSNSSFLCQPIFHQSNNDPKLGFVQKQKIPFCQTQNIEQNKSFRNLTSYNTYIDESIVDKKSFSHQNMLISQSSYGNIPPCNQYNNMEPYSGSTHEITTRQKFTKEEDDMLIKMVNIYGAKKWSRIASKIPGRTPRQCRDRYANYLAPGFKNSEWSLCEDILLVEKFSQYGSQWTLISHYFQGRTPNSIKNRWKYNVSRRVDSLLSQTKSNTEISDISNSPDQTNFSNDEDNKLVIPLQVKLERKKEDSNLKQVPANQSKATFLTNTSHIICPSSFSYQNSSNISHQINHNLNESVQNTMISANKCNKMGKSNDKIASSFENCVSQIDDEDSNNDIWPYFDDDEYFGNVSIFS